MTILGIFTAREHGFNDTTRMLRFKDNVRAIPIDGHKNMGPEDRILASATEIGAAWKRLCNTNRPYPSAKFDGSFVAPGNVPFISGEGGGTS